MSPEKFLNNIVVNILDESMCTEKNYSLGGSKNTFRQCIERNNGIGKKVSTMLINLVIKHPEKKDKIFKYLEQYLTENEIKYMYQNPNEIKTIINFAVKKINTRNKINEKHLEDDNQYKIVDINTLLKMGWTIRDYVKTSTLLSLELMEGLTDEHITELEKSIKVVAEQPENRRILLDGNNKMVGMWSFKPFYDDIFQKAKNGELFDSEISPNMMPTLIPGTYNIYFSNIVLKEQYRKTIVFKILLFSIIELIEKWANEGIFINEICAQAYTDSGLNLCKSIGLNFHKKHIDHGDIYCGYVYDLVEKPFCKDFENARNLYREFKLQLKK
jgi:hypothetical protein